MEYTVEQAYEAMKQGAKCEPGDPVYDWLLKRSPDNQSNRTLMEQYLKKKHFDQFVYDYKIWKQCRHVIQLEPLKEGEILDDDDIDDDGDRINWLLIKMYSMLFTDAWYTSKTRLQMIVDHIDYIKQQIISCQCLDMVDHHVHCYDISMALLKEWIKHANITTKAELIKHLPLNMDCNLIIHDMYKHMLS